MCQIETKAADKMESRSFSEREGGYGLLRLTTAVAAIVLGAVLLSSCGKPNNPPVIYQFGQSYRTLAVNEWNRLWCAAIDHDSDNIAFDWYCNAGSIRPRSSDSALVDWRAPGVPGEDTIIVVVTDEHGASDSDTALVTVTETFCERPEALNGQ
jgi:hypothetical protein